MNDQIEFITLRCRLTLYC